MELVNVFDENERLAVLSEDRFQAIHLANKEIRKLQDQVDSLRAELAQARNDIERKDVTIKLAREWIDAILSPLQGERAE